MAEQTDGSKGRKRRRRERPEHAGHRLLLVGFTVPAPELPEAVTAHPLVRAALELKDGDATCELWVPLGDHEGEKHAVITAVAQTAEGDEIPGRYRAPSVSAWRGGLELEPPPQLRLDRKPLD